MRPSSSAYSGMPEILVSQAMDQPVQLFHGTTARAAASIVRDGWRPLDVRAAVQAEALLLNEDADKVWANILAEPQSYLGRQGRGQRASFALSYERAAHRWAQRAPECRREVLWAVWRLRHPDRARTWPQQADGHAWVLRRLLDDQPAVLAITAPYSELVAAGARMSSFRDTPLVPYERLTGHVAWPEVAVPLPMRLDVTTAVVTVVSRHVEADIYRLLLGLSTEEFEHLARAGSLGSKGSGDEDLMRLGVTQSWWPLETVQRVLGEQGAPGWL